MDLMDVDSRWSIRQACVPRREVGLLAWLIGSSLGLVLHCGVTASAQSVGLDSPTQIRAGGLGIDLEAAQFNGHASGPLAGRTMSGTPAWLDNYDNDGPLAAGVPERRAPRGFNPGAARPRVGPVPFAVTDLNDAVGSREPLPRLQASLPLLVQPMGGEFGADLAARVALPGASGLSLSQPSLGRAHAPVPRPMVGPAVGVKPILLTSPNR